MNLIFIGTGSAFTVNTDNFHSNILLLNKQNDAKLLIDCGSDARRALARLGYSYKDITHVYISHLHADHVGSLEWLGLCRMFDSSTDKPHLFGQREILKKLWENTLSGGMKTLQESQASLETFFQVHDIEHNGEFTWENIVFHLIKTFHIFDFHELSPSYGLFFEINSKKIFLTTDTKFAPHIYMDLYKKADIIFHDCEISLIHSGVHAHFEELKTLDASIKAKMWLYHYNNEPLPDAKANGFCGFVKCGQTFSF